MSEDAKKQAARKLYTPQAVQNRVIERHLDGASNREIAAEVGIDRATVPRILAQQELVALRAEHQSRLERLVSKALDVYEETLGSNDAHLAAATATKILEGTGTLDKRGLQGTIDDCLQREVLRKTPPPPEFQQGPHGFVRPKSKRGPVKTELHVVSDSTLDEQIERKNTLPPERGQP